MNDETLVALRNLARARSLETAARGELQEARDRYRHVEGEHADRVADLHDAERAFRSALDADRGLLAEAVLGTDEHLHEFRVVDDRIVCDCGFSSGRDGTFQNGVEVITTSYAGWDSIHAAIGADASRARLDQANERLAAKSRSQTCMVGFLEGHDCRKPSGHNGQHTWEVTAEELAEAEEVRSADATSALVAQAKERAYRSGHTLVDGDHLASDHHPFLPDVDGRCCYLVGYTPGIAGDPQQCGKDPNAPVHLLYAGDGNTRVDYTPTPKGTD